MLHDVIYFTSIRDRTFDLAIWWAGLVGEKGLKGPFFGDMTHDLGYINKHK